MHKAKEQAIVELTGVDSIEDLEGTEIQVDLKIALAMWDAGREDRIPSNDLMVELQIEQALNRRMLRTLDRCANHLKYGLSGATGSETHPDEYLYNAVEMDDLIAEMHQEIDASEREGV